MPSHRFDFSAAEETNITAVALASIAAKYPSLDVSELTLDSMSRETPPSGAGFIWVRYILPSSAKTNEYDAPEGKRVKITTESLNVVMSPSRKVQSVSEAPREVIYKIGE
jgi:hypothetical protein